MHVQPQQGCCTSSSYNGHRCNRNSRAAQHPTFIGNSGVERVDGLEGVAARNGQTVQFAVEEGRASTAFMHVLPTSNIGTSMRTL